MYTPHDVHYGLAEEQRRQRALVLADAYARYPERFPRGLPQPKAVPAAVWINPPVTDPERLRLENTPAHGSDHNEIVAPRASVELVSRVDGAEIGNLKLGKRKLVLIH
jgi:hypothetical protein